MDVSFESTPPPLIALIIMMHDASRLIAAPPPSPSSTVPYSTWSLPTSAAGCLVCWQDADQTRPDQTRPGNWAARCHTRCHANVILFHQHLVACRVSLFLGSRVTRICRVAWSGLHAPCHAALYQRRHVIKSCHPAESLDTLCPAEPSILIWFSTFSPLGSGTPVVDDFSSVMGPGLGPWPVVDKDQSFLPVHLSYLCWIPHQQFMAGH